MASCSVIFYIEPSSYFEKIDSILFSDMICESLLLDGMILQFSMLSCECQLQIGTCHWHLPPTSTRIKSCAAVAADFQHPLRGVQGGDQKWSTLCSCGGGEGTGRTGLHIVIYLILWTQFLHLLISRKVLKSFMVTTASCG